MSKDGFIEIPKELYKTLIENFNKVVDVYKENGELRGKIISLEAEKKILANLQNSAQISSHERPQRLVEDIASQDSENSNINNAETFDSLKSEELIFSTIEDEKKKEQSIKNSSRVIGFWIFLFSLLSIIGNFWFQNFSLLLRDIQITLGVFGPFMFGGILSILNPKLPGIVGWILSVSVSTFFALNYFEILNFI